MKLDAKIPAGPLAQKWDQHKFDMKLVNPANKRKFDIIVVGTGLAGASAAASLAELGYKVKAFCYQDSPRRAHSIAAQGGINAAKNYQNDGDSVYRLFYDTIKGGDFRAREANVYRLAQVSVNIIDQCVAQGVPFAREYGGLLANRSFGGAQVSRTFYARGQTGQQLLLGAYQALCRQIGARHCQDVSAHGDARSGGGQRPRQGASSCATWSRGEISAHAADAVVLATGGYGNVFYLSTNAKGCNVTATWRAYKKGAAFANPCYTQIHPTCIPVSGDHQSKLTLMSESLRNDGRVWVPKKEGRQPRRPRDIPEDERDYYLERKYPSFGNLAPRDISSRAAKEVCDEGRGVGPGGRGRLSGFCRRHPAPRRERPCASATEICLTCMKRSPARTPIKRRCAFIPAVHYTMGGLWVDYNLMSNVPGLVCAGRGEFFRSRRQPPRRQRAHAGAGRRLFRRCLTPSGIISPRPNSPRRARTSRNSRKPSSDVQALTKKLLGINGKRTVNSFHKELGTMLWEKCGMARERKGIEGAAAADSRLARGILEKRQSDRAKRGVEPEPGTRRARGGFSGIRRTAVPGRVAPARIVRRPFPHGISNRRRRGQAGRREFRLRGRLGIRRAGPAAGLEQGTAGL